MPMAFLRPISGSATLAILTNIYQTYGPDSYIGNLASVIQGCTDTTIYVLALYFSSIKIKNIRYSLWVGLFADLIGIIMAFLLSSWLFS
jgi:spore maturation protein B